MIDILGTQGFGIIVVGLLVIALVLVISIKKLENIGFFLITSIVASVLFGVWQFHGLMKQSASEISEEYTHGTSEKIVDDNIEDIELIETIKPFPSEEIVQIGMEMNEIKSAPAETEGVTMCSKTARITLKSLTGKSYSTEHDGSIAQGDAIRLIEKGLSGGTLTEVRFDFGGVNPSQTLFEMLAHNELEIADVYLYRDDPDYGKLTFANVGKNEAGYKKYLEQAHRFVVVLGTDGILYALDPYRGGVGTKPQLLRDYVKMIDGRTMYVGQTYDANVDQSILTYYETTKKSYDSVQPQGEVLPTIEEVQGGVEGYLQVKKPKVRVESIMQSRKSETVDELKGLLDL